MALNLAENAAQLSSQMTIYTAGLTKLGSQLEAAAAEGSQFFKFHVLPISHLSLPAETGEPTVIKLEFPDGTTRAGLVHNSLTMVKGPCGHQLGLEL